MENYKNESIPSKYLLPSAYLSKDEYLDSKKKTK